MRAVLIAGNWKMNKDLQESRDLIQKLRRTIGPGLPSHVHVAIFPPFPFLALASELLKESRISVGAQNMSEHDDGAFTGEVSGRMLRSIGCEYVILGHSERRQLFGETNSTTNRKTKKALDCGLTPVICVGETLDQRERGTTRQVVGAQVRESIAGFRSDLASRLVLAYEPVWSIGTGRNATPDQAQEIHGYIREIVAEMYGGVVGEGMLILYGGSVKPDNAREILKQKDIDGALVGGACLQADSFTAIVESGKL
jgi:triosephosphate isomerase